MRHSRAPQDDRSGELDLALREIAALKAWKDRASIIMLRLNERVSALEGADAQPEAGGMTVRGFAEKIHRSPSLVRKYIKAGRIPVLPSLGARVIIADSAALPARKRRP
jgi:hypothetical protein